MLKLLTPHLQLASVLDIRLDLLHGVGVEGLLLDLDGTLKGYYESDFQPEIVGWLQQMKREQVAICLVTNGRGARVEPLAERLGVACVSFAKKPFPWGVRAAMARLRLDRTRVALVGDQVFADVLAGRLAGVFTILVPPIAAREPWITHIKRPLERFLLRRASVSHTNQSGDGRESPTH